LTEAVSPFRSINRAELIMVELARCEPIHFGSLCLSSIMVEMQNHCSTSAAGLRESNQMARCIHDIGYIAVITTVLFIYCLATPFQCSISSPIPVVHATSPLVFATRWPRSQWTLNFLQARIRNHRRHLAIDNRSPPCPGER